MSPVSSLAMAYDIFLTYERQQAWCVHEHYFDDWYPQAQSCYGILLPVLWWFCPASSSVPTMMYQCFWHLITPNSFSANLNDNWLVSHPLLLSDPIIATQLMPQVPWAFSTPVLPHSKILDRPVHVHIQKYFPGAALAWIKSVCST